MKLVYPSTLGRRVSIKNFKSITNVINSLRNTRIHTAGNPMWK